MNTSGEAADQVVRMSMEVGEAALKISGEGAKQLAVLLYAVLKEQKKTKGRIRLESLVRSGKPLTVFAVHERDLKKFVQEAKRYGILYSAIRNPKGSEDGMVDIMVKEEDAPRLNRIVERFKLASVSEAAKVRTEIEKTREDKAKAESKDRGSDEKAVSKDKHTKEEKADQLVDELFGEEEMKEQSPFLPGTENRRPSESISERGEDTKTFSKPDIVTGTEKPSVRKQLQEIRERREKEEKRNEPERSQKGKNQTDKTRKKSKSGEQKPKQLKSKNQKVKER